MTLSENLTIRRLQRVTVADGRQPPPTEAIEHITTDRKREQHLGWFGYRLRPSGRDYYRRGPTTALITRCDLQERFHVNFDDGQYAVWPMPPFSPRGEITNASGYPAATRQNRRPTLLIETETVDTGERRIFFDWSARHVLTKRHIIPLQGSRRTPSTTLIEGWYIDLEMPILCEPSRERAPSRHALLSVYKEGEEPDWPTFKDIGEPESGFPVLTRTTSIDRLKDDGSTEVHTINEIEVTELSTIEIEAALFEIPRGFTRVEHIREEAVPPLLVRWNRWYRHVLQIARSDKRTGRNNREHG
jgi:hypothetical protein